MKILYFSDSFGSPTTTFIRNETEYFNQTAEIKYLCNSLYPGIDKYNYVTVIPFNENRVIKKIRWWLWKLDLWCNFKNNTYAKILNQEVNLFKPDIIHCHFGYEALMLLDNISNFNQRKIIIHFHGYDASKMLRKKSYIKKLKEYLSKPNVLTLSCNQFFIEQFKAKYQIKISNYNVLKYGIDTTNLFNSIVSSELNNFIIQVSSLVEKKGHEYTIQAFKMLVSDSAYQNYKLVLTGDGSRKLHLMTLVNSLGLNNQVVFLGTLTPVQVSEYLSKSKVFVHHSITDSTGDMEGIPNAIMEAMAMELPIVSTLHSGIPELVENGINGYLVEEKNIYDYTNKMKLALCMGKLSINRNKILQEHSLGLHNQKLADLYNYILNK